MTEDAISIFLSKIPEGLGIQKKDTEVKERNY
jgi:hypothetical protein